MSGRLKRIYVSQHVIRANGQSGARDAPLTVNMSDGNHRAHEVSIEGPSRLVYSPDAPLGRGAKVWIETTAPVGIWRRIDHSASDPSC